jgi:hypothetical protein
LVAFDTMSLHSGESRDSFDQRCSIYQNMTMGQIAALFLERLCGNNPPASQPDNNGHSGVSLRFSIRLGDGMQLEERSESFAALIEQRNEFVHHLCPKFASAGPGTHKPLAEELDAQCIQIREEVNRLKHDFESVRSSFAAIMAFVASPEGTAEVFGHEIRNSPLIRNLAEIASQSNDPEGWIPLREAITKLKDFPEKKIGGHCAQFGQKSLSALLTASGLFETRQTGSTPDNHGIAVFRSPRTALSRAQRTAIACACFTGCGKRFHLPRHCLPRRKIPTNEPNQLSQVKNLKSILINCERMLGLIRRASIFKHPIRFERLPLGKTC